MKKKNLFGWMLTMLFVMPLLTMLAWADGATDPLPTQDFLALLLNSVGQVKGATGMAIAVLVTQLVMAFFRTPLANFAGRFRLLIVMALSLVAGLIALKVSGLSWGAALIHSSTLGAFQVLGHQLYVQFIQKSTEPSVSTTTTK